MNAVAEREALKNHDAVKLIGWSALGYAWRIAASLLQIIVVLYIFSRMEDRFDNIVVATSGLNVFGRDTGLRLLRSWPYLLIPPPQCPLGPSASAGRIWPGCQASN